MLPDSIGNLVQLRYLDLSHTEIKSLPDTLCNLYFLQSLLLSCCSKLTKLPEHIGKLINLRHLEIDSTRIMEMPKQIVELKHLQTLTVYVVGKQNIGLSVRELKRFPKLRGKLCIKNLENVIEVEGASDSDLKSRKHIEELMLQWGKETDGSLISNDVLGKLRPSPNLKKLSIDLYGGTSFPSWLGDSSFSNMVSICIDNCAYCVTLPPLGRLPSLKNLRIGRMNSLVIIEGEFYGNEGGSNSSFQPFPLLEDLVIVDMSEWEEWLPFQGNNKSPFPSLKTLKLSNCGKLKGYLPCHLPCIEKIEIYNCEDLSATPPESTLHRLSSIKKIVMERSQWSLLESDSLCLHEDIKIQHSPVLEFVPKMIMKATCLQYLNLTDIPSLTEFPADGLPTSLKSLRIHDCEQLQFLPPETWSKYTSLVILGLKNSCGALKSFPLNSFPMLQDLSIENCRSLESIFISETSFSLSTLQYLFVCGCEELKSLPQQMNTLTALGEIYLMNLPKLSFCDGVCLPPKLQSLCVDSERIAVPVAEWSLQLQGLTALSRMVMGGDDIVTMLLKGQKLPISLVSLTIRNLSETKSLEGCGLQHLSSLKELIFLSCSELQSFPENTLPSSLKSLSYSDCPRLESLPEDSLPSNLELLYILECHLLEKRYKREEHRSKIARIPVIMINDQVTI
jgi:Leucine-rich repeat (LRR) protein